MLGDALGQAGRLDEAVANYKVAIRAYRQQDDQPAARTCYDKAVALLEKNQAAAENVEAELPRRSGGAHGNTDRRHATAEH